MKRELAISWGFAPLLIALAGACSSASSVGIADDAGSPDDATSSFTDSGVRADSSMGADTSTTFDSSISDTSTSDTSTRSDSSMADASDASSAVDATDSAVPDAGADADAGVCAPGSIAGFTPAWKPPTGLRRNLCTASQTTAFVNCLSGIPDATTCNAFMAAAANAACIDCALTRTSAAMYGALIEDPTTISLNSAGCVALVTADVSSTGCGAKQQAVDQCEVASCAASCPVPSGDQTAFNAYIKCLGDSDATTCKTYSDAAACFAADLQPDGSAPGCAPTGATFTDNATQYVTLFCGP